MKKSTLIILAMLMAANAFAFVTVAKSDQIASKQLSFEQFMHLSPQEIQNKTGQKLSFTEKLGLKLFQYKLKKALRKTPPECSKIVMKDGDIIEANVLQITPTEIKYKRCGKPNDPELVIYKKDVLSVKAADGEIIFRNTGNNNDNNNNGNNGNNNNNGNNGNNNNNRDNNYGTGNNSSGNNNSNEPKTEGNALAGMICSIAGLVLSFSILGLACGIVGLILSIIGRKKISNDTKRFKGKGLAMAGIICGIIACAIYALILSAAAAA
jgi:hypothetical protein